MCNICSHFLKDTSVYVKEFHCPATYCSLSCGWKNWSQERLWGSNPGRSGFGGFMPIWLLGDFIWWTSLKLHYSLDVCLVFGKSILEDDPFLFSGRVTCFGVWAVKDEHPHVPLGSSKSLLSQWPMGAMVLKLLDFKASGHNTCCRNMEFKLFLGGCFRLVVGFEICINANVRLMIFLSQRSCWDQSDGNCYEPINQMDSEALSIFLWSSWWAQKLPTHTVSPRKRSVSSLQKIMKQSHFCFYGQSCFSSSRFIFRHLKIWKRLMLCHRTGLKLFTVHHSGFNSAAGWNCGSLLRYAVWNPVVRIFLVCFAAGSWRYDRRGILQAKLFGSKFTWIFAYFLQTFFKYLEKSCASVLVGSHAEFCERRVSLVVLWPYVTREHVFIAQVQGAENEFLLIPISSQR